MDSMTKSDLSWARLELGVVTNVDFEKHTVRVRSQMSEQYSYTLPIISPYVNQTTGIGFKWMPQGGETVIMAVLSDGDRRLIGFTGVDEDGSHNYGFGDMNGGDFFLRGGNGSFLRIRSGGVVEIGSTPICSSIYIPTRNITHHISENWILDTFAGSLEFRCDRAEDSDEGHTPSYMTLKMKEFTDDENELVRLKVGGGQDDLAVNLIIKDSGNGENVKAGISISKNGDLKLSLERDFTYNIKGKTSISSTGDVTIETQGKASLKADQDMTLSGSSVKISSDSSLTMEATNTSIDSSQVSISNSAAFPVLRLSPDLQALLAAVSAVVKIPLSSLHFNNNVTV